MRYLRRTGESVALPLSLAWRRRSLLAVLVQREITARTAGTWLGVVWLGLQPVLQVVGFWFLLVVILRVRSGSNAMPFVDYFLLGMAWWLLLAESISRAASVMSEFAPVYQRNPFPLGLLPLVPWLVAVATYAVVLSILTLMLVGPLALPGLWLLLLLFALWLLPWLYAVAVVSVFYKDLLQALPLLLTALLYLSPVLYMPDMFPLAWRSWFSFNPMADWLALLHGWVQGGAWDWVNLARPWLWWLALAAPAWTLFCRAEPQVREAL
jgi:lipopolysaccharide transport system permease protein